MKKTAKKPEKEADVILAASEQQKDLLYATGFSAPDPFPFFQIKHRKYVMASDLEIGRARSEANVTSVLSTSKVGKRLKKRTGKAAGLGDILIEALKEKGVTKARVPHDFPVYTADRMRRAGIKVRPVLPPFFPERVIKSEEEIEAVREAATLTGQAIELGIDVLRRSSIKRGRLWLDGKMLTSESVRAVVDGALLTRGLQGQGTIVAGGEQACDPHNRGSGPLRAGWPVIFDVFPRSLKSGYHADISRTVIRGKPKKRQREMWEAVKEAQALGCDRLKDGVNAKEVHEAIQEIFKSRGFETGEANGKMHGFFHGTGHGLGLDVHEPPRVGGVDATMRAGMIVTVEPGLYYPGVGGIRIEDDVVIRKDGTENLVDIEKYFELS
jgi:Xaa-Pro aminopeptidase